MLKELTHDKNILKKAYKETTTVVMNRENNLEEGQILLNDRNNYRPLDKPKVESTAETVSRFIESVFRDGSIDRMTAKWLSLTPNSSVLHTNKGSQSKASWQTYNFRV